MRSLLLIPPENAHIKSLFSIEKERKLDNISEFPFLFDKECAGIPIQMFDNAGDVCRKFSSCTTEART